MKRIISIVLVTIMVFMSGVKLSAQGKYGADSAECIKYLSYYKEYYKQKNYNDALPNWRKAYKICPPTANQGMLIDGASMLRRLIAQNSKNLQYRAALIDTLMTLHDVRAKYYPKYSVHAMNNKGLDIINFYQNDNDKLYNLLKPIIEANGDKVKSSILLLELKAAIELYQAGKLNTDDVLSLYQNNMSLLDNIMKENPNNELDSKVKADMESLFITSKVANCDNLIQLFTPRYEANPKDLALVTNIVKMLGSADDCTNNDLYVKAATSLYELQPTAQAAYFLYKLYAARDNKEKALSYLEAAINSPDLNDDVVKADYYYQLAAYCFKNSMNVKAMEAATKASELDKALAGKSYFIMGTIWNSVVCTGDEITKRAKYWVATDYMQKAKAADPTLAAECNKMISQFANYYPTAPDAFMYNLTEGQSYTVNCGGLKATTTVRTQKN